MLRGMCSPTSKADTLRRRWRQSKVHSWLTHNLSCQKTITQHTSLS